jgi:hypothetical protein
MTDLVKAAIAIFEIALRYHVVGFRREQGRVAAEPARPAGVDLAE